MEEESTIWIGLIFFVLILVLIGVVVHKIMTSGTVGYSCSNNADCVSGLVCDTSTLSCRQPPGGTCTVSADCTSNSACTNGVCVVSAHTVTGAMSMPLVPLETPVTTSAPREWTSSDAGCDNSTRYDHTTRGASGTTEYNTITGYSDGSRDTRSSTRREGGTKHKYSTESMLPRTEDQYSFTLSVL